MPVRVGINGFGRIGRNFFRARRARGADIDVVAVNDLTDAATLAHLLKYDSVLGRYHGHRRGCGDGHSSSTASRSSVLAERDPADAAVERARRRRRARVDRPLHRPRAPRRTSTPARKKVIISAPAKDPDVTIVLGVNDEIYDPRQHHIISNASCTTNCLAPVAKVLLDEFGIESGLHDDDPLVHNDQRILDLPHKDLRRARAAALSIIPTSTGAAKAIGARDPGAEGQARRLRDARADAGRLDRRPRRATLGREASDDEINAAMQGGADTGRSKGILDYTDEPIVSQRLHRRRRTRRSSTRS